MNCFSRLVAPLLVALPLLIAGLAVAPAPAAATRYVCPPCGSPCDTTAFDKPGNCPLCGMTLVDAASVTAPAAPARKVAMLVFNGVEIIDYTGPWEVFGAAGFEVYSVAATRDPILTSMGMTVVPRYTFADAPQPDVLLVPGGGVRSAASDDATLAWIRKTSAGTVHTMSVCNGAFILASTGLLDGLTATTTYSNIERMRTTYPKVKVVNDQRFVDNGKIITTGGLSAGIDGALHVVSRMQGEGEAQQVALSLEYDWRPKTPFTRAAFADRLVPDVDLTRLGTWKILSTQGGTDHWDFVARGTTGLDAAQLQDRIGAEFTKNHWTRAGKPAGNDRTQSTSTWTFTDPDGHAWSGTLSIQGVPNTSGQYTTRLSIARAHKTS
jgi:putative intracellular protease/amidase